MTEETALTTTVSSTAMTVANEPFDNGLGELSAGDLIIPRLSITQPTTPDIDAAMVGKFAVNVTGDFHDTMRVVIIKFTKGRILFPEKYNRENDPLCRSHDFMVPADDIKDAVPMCDTCGLIPGDPKNHVCPYANWGVEKGKAVAPRCQEVWNLLVVDIDNYMPMWFSIKSTALRPARKMISAISMISTAKKIPMWGMQFAMGLVKETNDSGTFYTPTFSNLSPLQPADAENMALIRQQLVNVDVRDSNEPLANDAPAQVEPEQF